MRAILSVLAVIAMTGAAFAGDVPQDPVGPAPDIACDFGCITYDWDFAVGDHGFTAPYACDTGGLPVWQYGPTTYVPGAPGDVWGTILNADYPSEAGDGLLSPPFEVNESACLMEILHYVHIETNYDGGNVTVDGQVIPPMAGYPAVISTSTGFYAWCVDMEEGFTGNGYSGPSEAWTLRCFDLSQFLGMTIQVEFDFGSDSSVVYPGWYIAYVKIGSVDPSAVDGETWGAIKGLFK